MKDRDALTEQLSHFQPLAALDRNTLELVAPHCSVEKVAPDQDPFRLRDWHGRVLYLIRGQLKIEFPDGSIKVLVGGCDDALLPIVNDGQMPVGGRSITEIELLHIEDKTLDIALTWDQLTSPGVSGREGGTDDWRSTTGKFALRELTRGAFAALPPAHIEQLLDRFQRVSVKSGQVVVREGDVGDYFYLIESGRCLVTRMHGGMPMVVAELGNGDTFGEEALVAETLRNATVSMESDGVLLRLAKGDFVELLRAPLLKSVDPVTARAKIADGACWLDVRLPVEWRLDGLPGAINLPLNELRKDFGRLDPDKEYIVYCQTGRRSSAATFLLGQRGLRAHLLQGGLRLWQQMRKG